MPIPNPQPAPRRGRPLERGEGWTYIERLRWLAGHRGYVSHIAVLLIAAAGVALTIGRIADAELLARAPVRQESAGFLTAPILLNSRATPTPAPSAAVTAGPVQSLTHEVVAGDTLTAIAEQYGVSVDYLIWNNPEVGADPDTLLIGKQLLIPGTDGLVYDVRLGDTINDIAATFGVDPAAIIDYEANNLDSPDLIIEGMVLLLPGGVPPPPPPPVEEPVLDVPADAGAPAFVGDVPTTAQPAAVAAPVPAAPIVASVGYIWPVNGTLWSGFGPRWGSFHKGIDIGSGYGSPVAAAASGQVILSTYSNNGYGNYIIVRHDDGSETLYAHLSERYVGLGEYVSQGQTVGAIGCTGWCSGDHLHFEVHIGGTPVDPLGYLP